MTSAALALGNCSATLGGRRITAVFRWSHAKIRHASIGEPLIRAITRCIELSLELNDSSALPETPIGLSPQPVPSMQSIGRILFDRDGAGISRDECIRPIHDCICTMLTPPPRHPTFGAEPGLVEDWKDVRAARPRPKPDLDSGVGPRTCWKHSYVSDVVVPCQDCAGAVLVDRGALQYRNGAPNRRA